jgi:hypothetical protein
MAGGVVARTLAPGRWQTGQGLSCAKPIQGAERVVRGDTSEIDTYAAIKFGAIRMVGGAPCTSQEVGHLAVVGVGYRRRRRVLPCWYLVGLLVRTQSGQPIRALSAANALGAEVCGVSPELPIH